MAFSQNSVPAPDFGVVAVVDAVRNQNK